MDNLLAKYKKIKKSVQVLGFVIPGRIRTTYLRCGKEGCKCKSGKVEDKHGPYTFWDRQTNTGLSSASINREHKQLLLQGIRNRKKLNKLISEMLKLGEEYVRSLKNS